MQYTYGLTRTVGHGHAFTQRVVVPSPAAGGGFTYLLDSKYWRVFDSIAFELVTSDTDADRQVVLQLVDGDGVALQTLPAASTQAATLTYQYTWSPSFSNFNTVVDLAVTSPFSDGFVPPNFALVVTVGSVDSGDQVSNIRIMEQKYVTGDAGYVLGSIDVGPLLGSAVTVATLTS